MKNYELISVGINETLGIHPQIQHDVLDFLTEPTKANWDRIHKYMVNDKQTFFSAVCQRESSFAIARVQHPFTGEFTWMKIPTPKIIRNIIRENTYNLLDTCGGQFYKLN